LIESETLDNEQAALFRSGLGLVLYIAMDRPDLQFAVKTLSSYISKPSTKAMAALKHLTSYLDGTPDSGILLKTTEQGKTLSDFWRNDDLIQNETTVPESQNGQQKVVLLWKPSVTAHGLIAEQRDGAQALASFS